MKPLAQNTLIQNRYLIVHLIGKGGMGEVYLARDERLRRKVALKFLPVRLTANETQLSRFKSEARAASALNHPNILTVYEIGTEGNRHFIATEFIEGATLRATLARGKMSVHEALEELATIDARLAQVVEMRYFGGLLEQEIAEALGVTERTIQRDWQKARILLSMSLKD